MNKKVAVIGVPMDLGAGRRGVDMGPSAIRYAGLQEQIEALGLAVHDHGDLIVHHASRLGRGNNPNLHYLGEVVRVNQELAALVASVGADGEFPLILGGDHSIGIGALAGAARLGRRLGVIWLDAHGDFNTDRTTPSGNIHGMSLAASVGRGHPDLLAAWGTDPFVSEADVHLIGTRDLDPAEREALEDSGRRLPKTEADHPGGLPDVFGGVAFSLTLVFLLLALSAASMLSVVWLMAALVSGITFSLRQRRAATPFLDTAPLKTSSGAFMMAAAGIIGLDLAAAVFVPALAQQELHFSVLLSGVALMPAAVVGAVLAGAAGVLVDRLGARRVLQVGLAAAGVGGVLIALPDLTVVRFVIAMAFFGFGTAFTLGAPINRLATLLYRKDQLGEALSLVAVARAVGLMVGPVVFGLMITNSGFSAPFWLLAVVSALGVMLLFQVPNWLQPSQVAS